MRRKRVTRARSWGWLLLFVALGPSGAGRAFADVLPPAVAGDMPAAPTGDRSAGTKPEEPAEGSRGRHRLTILHTNDVHASFRPVQASWRADTALIGGFEMLDVVVRRVREEVPATLLLDAGDMMTGNPISRIPDDGVPGWGLFSLMNIVHYDAWAIGNHDFDQGQANLHGILSRLEFPSLSANLVLAADSPIAHDLKPYVIETVGALRVGIIGLMTPDLKRVSAAGVVAGVEVAAPVPRLRELVSKIDPQTDVIIVLSHMGDDLDRAVAAQVEGVDVIVGGHTHRRLYPPVRVGDTLIVQTGAKLQYLGRLDLVIAQDRVVDYEGTLIPLWVRTDVRVSRDVREGVAHARRLVEAEFGVRLGYLEVPWTRNYYGESNVGDWITDALRRRAGTDVAFLNSGGIRSNLPPGPVSKGDLMTVLPFDNQLCTFEVTGAALERIVEANARAAVEQTHGILQVSGLRYRFAVQDGNVHLVSLEVGGAPVDRARMYTGATNEYMLFSQPGKYFAGAKLGNPTCLGITMLDAVADTLKAEERVDARVDGRILQR